MIEVHQLPLVNASLNATAATLVAIGVLAIRRGRVSLHRACMVGALLISTLFLASYLYYHAVIGSVRFTTPGWPRAVYFAILFSHIPLAAIVVPMALVTALRALRGRFDAHVRIARWTAPIWLYVSITGVLVYMFLYQWFE